MTFLVPQSADDLRRMGRCFASTTFLSAGNVTHTPAYGNLIALGILDAVQRRNPSPDHVATAARYRDWLAATGRFRTFSGGGATIGYRFRDDPDDRVALRLVKETDAGIVVHGKVGMHTSVPFVEDVYIGTGGAVTYGSQRATMVVSVAAPGVTVVCRKRAARHHNPFLAPLSSRSMNSIRRCGWTTSLSIPIWRNRLRSWFSSYNALANGVLATLNLEMPTIDVRSLRQVPQGPRRPVTVPSRRGPAAGS